MAADECAFSSSRHRWRALRGRRLRDSPRGRWWTLIVREGVLGAAVAPLFLLLVIALR